MKFGEIIKTRAFKDFSVILLLMGLPTLNFRLTDADIALQRYFYSPEKGWLLQFHPFWDFITVSVFSRVTSSPLPDSSWSPSPTGM